MPLLIEKEVGSAGACRLSSAVLRALDLCQFLIDHAYEQDRLRRLSEVTGLSGTLLENLITLKKKG
ncbi:MAG: hypothetical protein GC138_02180 [Gammaproteobacteria bacterium]|nr:hypothetical protein [Gammaproteobacteria bacterium]